MLNLMARFSVSCSSLFPNFAPTTRTNEGWWNNISVWSFKSGTWNEIAETNAFISDDKDFENRIIKEKVKLFNWTR